MPCVTVPFRRDESGQESLLAKLRSLESDAVYTLTDVDANHSTELSGRELLENELSVAIPNRPGAVVIIYKTNRDCGDKRGGIHTMIRQFPWQVLPMVVVILGGINLAWADNPATLRLVPFPKQVTLEPGVFPLDGKLVLEAPAASAPLLGSWINAELQRAGMATVEVRNVDGELQVLRLSAGPAAPPTKSDFRPNATPEDYTIQIGENAVVCAAPSEAGLCHAAHTLCQLIRANRRGMALPSLTICDWPSLAWRGFQDDMTRGPSATLETLQKEVDLGAASKMNLFTYYMEYQFAYQKHPVIGPKDGSLKSEELKTLVQYAAPRHVGILGSQQSFGHSDDILKHPEYAAIRETPGILSPAKEETYKFLDDLYSEVLPVLPFPWFNVCCDEVESLKDTTGPSRELVATIGPGSLYVQHVRRVHDLLKDKYGKRMMMWGDIILQHPDKLEQIPKDTILLTWAYDPRPDFESQIAPFATSGYEFLVCPGVDNWNRLVPDFGHAMVNIRNFVRDGANRKALGMLNTEWKDGGEMLRGSNWHGYAWGAECAWNASATEPEDFNRRIGAVLFGEKDDHFGQAIELLSKAHRLPIAQAKGLGEWPQGITNARFWMNDFAPTADEAEIRGLAEPLLALVRPATQHLEACKKDAVVNADLLDAFLYGARRMELVGQRMLDGLEAAKAYAEAVQAATREEKLARLLRADQLLCRNRDAFRTLGDEFSRIWRLESKPYSLDWTTKRYADTLKWYEDLLVKLADARKRVEAGNPLLSPREIGLVN